MRFLAIQLTSLLLLFPLSTSLSCDIANWWGSLDRPGWSVCPKTNTYIKGFYRNDPRGNNHPVYLLEEGRCCGAGQGYTNQPASCRNADWTATLDRTNVWAKCPTGYYLNGIRISGADHLHQIEEAKCCRPHNHPDTYQDCYEEDVTHPFDKKGWSECKRPDYYMTGFYKSSCDHLYCIETFSCCRMKDAPVNGGWSVWGDWGQCSSSCGGGVKERMRTCTSPPPAYGGAQCSGPDKETQQCNSAPCPVNGGWSDFGDWSECSVTCGSGVQKRSRSCTNPPPAHGGEECTGNDDETRECVSGPCNVDGGFSTWSTFSECSKTCGRGRKHRTRECTNPPPSGDGKNCKGKLKQVRKCKVRSCRGGFTAWSKFGECSKTCGWGKKQRTRECTNPPPAPGKKCKGKYKQTKKCKVRSCRGGFTAWSEFGECSKTCGWGKKQRTRECTNPPPAPGKKCKGKYKQTKKCKVRSCRGLYILHDMRGM